MLVLSRHRDESIILDTKEGQVVITVCDIRGDKCRLGIQAPQHMPVHRREVYESIQREKRNGNRTPATCKNCTAPLHTRSGALGCCKTCSETITAGQKIQEALDAGTLKVADLSQLQRITHQTYLRFNKAGGSV